MTGRRIASGFGLAVVTLLLWSWVGPSQLGGPLTLVVTSGISMQPMMHTGDLVLVRSADAYSPGDIILYRSEETGQDVLHRVLSCSDGTCVTKGDNNDWIDEYRPREEAISGVYWTHLAGAGAWTARLRSGGGSAMFALGLVGVVVASMTTTTPEARRTLRLQRGAVRGGIGTQAAAFAQSSTADMLIGLLGSLAVAALLLGIWSVRQPLTEAGFASVSYTHSANWSYSAVPGPAPARTPTAGVEPNSMVSTDLRTGQPIFPAITPIVEHTVNYQLSAPLIEDVGGRGRMYIVLREDTTGWSTQVEMAPWTEFVGSELTLAAVTDLAGANAALMEFQAATQIAAGIYRGVLVAEFEVNGSIGSGEDALPFEDTYLPYVVYRFTVPNMVRVEEGISATSAEILAAGIDPLAHVFNQSESREHVEPIALDRDVTVMGLTFGIATVRVLAGALAVAAVIGVVALFALRARADRWGTWFMIRSRYGDRLAMTTAAPADPHGRPYVEVTTFEDMLALSDVRMQPVLCVEGETAIEFFVMDLPNPIYRARLPKSSSSRERRVSDIE